MNRRLITLWDSPDECPFPAAAVEAALNLLPDSTVLALGPDRLEALPPRYATRPPSLPEHPPKNPRRRSQYCMGRQLAHSALEQLKVNPGDLNSALNRGPVWPQGTVGSITHTDQVAGAIVGLDSGLTGIGIDTECSRQLSTAAERYVLTPAERGDTTLSPVLRFSAKEAIYKCLAPQGIEPLRFHDVSVFWDAESLQFEPTDDCTWPDALRTLRGFACLADSHVLTVVWTLPQGQQKALAQR